MTISLFGKKKDKKGVATTPNQNPTVQGWLPVKDIENNHLTRKDDVNVGMVKIESVNLSLLSEVESKRIIKSFSDILNGFEFTYQFFTMPKPVDLDGFINGLEEIKSTEQDFIRRKILEEDIRDAAIMASDGEALDRHYYFIHEMEGTKLQDEDILLKRSQEIAEEFSGAGIRASVCNAQEIRDVLFIFLNPIQATIERSPKDGPYLPPIFGE